MERGEVSRGTSAGKHNSFKAGKEKKKSHRNKCSLKAQMDKSLTSSFGLVLTNPFKGLDGDFKGIKTQNQAANDS